jgi:DNA-directed RNA polymerase subunit RPC12/RpoP
VAPEPDVTAGEAGAGTGEEGIGTMNYRCRACKEDLGLLNREDAASFPEGVDCRSCGAHNGPGWLRIEEDAFASEADADREEDLDESAHDDLDAEDDDGEGEAWAGDDRGSLVSLLRLLALGASPEARKATFGRSSKKVRSRRK